MPLDIIVGAQWGDEGKGRMVDYLSAKADYVARYNGGDNAGHTVTVEDRTFKLHLIPSGIVHPYPISLIGNGVVVNPAVLLDEMDRLESAGINVTPERLKLSHAAHMITPSHLALDKAQEIARGKGKLGTTLRGIGPAYTSKISRKGLRLSILLDEQTCTEQIRLQAEEINQALEILYNAEPVDIDAVVQNFAIYSKKLAPYITDVSKLLTDALERDKRILAEGAQGTLLDLDHGTYPYVTSSNPSAPGALVGLGLGVGCVGTITGVVKAFQTRVGSGPFPTEIDGDIAEKMRGTGEHPWDEFGTTTGRPRRVGWLDGVLLRYATRINGLTQIALTKMDILTGINPIRICNGYRKDGLTFRELPFGVSGLSTYEPIYEELHGWEEDVSHVRHWDNLPLEARTYILRIEEISGIPIRTVSVGPERTQIIRTI
jgi:adenylosuccinate synthase